MLIGALVGWLAYKIAGSPPKYQAQFVGGGLLLGFVGNLAGQAILARRARSESLPAAPTGPAPSTAAGMHRRMLGLTAPPTT